MKSNIVFTKYYKTPCECHDDCINQCEFYLDEAIHNLGHGMLLTAYWLILYELISVAGDDLFIHSA